MSIEVKISLNKGLYIKEPQDSELGKKIIEHSIILIEECGFECFTFKKLAEKINSTEASIYRYFKSKHFLLLFLINWYWEWTHYLIEIGTMNVKNPKEKLRAVVKSIVFASKRNPNVAYVNEDKLHSIVISEGMKAYHTKDVDSENAKGFFKSYKDLAKTIANIILEVNPNFKYSYALATNLFETSKTHIYFAHHLPKLTDISIKENETDELEKMLNYFWEKLLD